MDQIVVVNVNTNTGTKTIFLNQFKLKRTKIQIKTKNFQFLRTVKSCAPKYVCLNKLKSFISLETARKTQILLSDDAGLFAKEVIFCCCCCSCDVMVTLTFWGQRIELFWQDGFLLEPGYPLQTLGLYCPCHSRFASKKHFLHPGFLNALPVRALCYLTFKTQACFRQHACSNLQTPLMSDTVN